MSFTVSTCDVYHSFDFQRQSGKSTMSKRPFYDLLPTIQCQTPRTVLCRLEDTPGIALRFYFKHQLVADSIVSFLEFFFQINRTVIHCLTSKSFETHRSRGFINISNC